MTEIEQKAVEEMAENQNVKNIQNIINNAIANNHGIINYNGMSVIYCAIDLHKAGYRKQSETVKEFAEKVNEIVKNTHNISSWHIWAIQEQINKLAEQYGKED